MAHSQNWDIFKEHTYHKICISSGRKSYKKADNELKHLQFRKAILNYLILNTSTNTQ